MGSGLRRLTRAFAVSLVLTALAATGAGAASPAADAAVARAGTFVASDFPTGFEGSPSSAKSHADNVRYLIRERAQQIALELRSGG